MLQPLIRGLQLAVATRREHWCDAQAEAQRVEPVDAPEDRDDRGDQDPELCEREEPPATPPGLLPAAPPPTPVEWADSGEDSDDWECLAPRKLPLWLVLLRAAPTVPPIWLHAVSCAGLLAAMQLV